MPAFQSPSTVVVGVDGSQAASGAAVWAASEAAGRHIPLRLVYIIYRDEVLGNGARRDDTDQLAAAHAALSDAHRAVEAVAGPAGMAVDVETQVLQGNPLTTLIELSRSAAMVCVGSVGIEHACHHAGSTAAALAGSARCPVAVIRPPTGDQHAHRPADVGYIVAEVDASPDNNAVLEWALTEARLRSAPLRIITAPSDDGAAGPSAQEQIEHRIARWGRRYPDVAVEPVDVPSGITGYLADNADSIQLFVSATRDRRSLGFTADTGGCSVLTVAGKHL